MNLFSMKHVTIVLFVLIALFALANALNTTPRLGDDYSTAVTYVTLTRPEDGFKTLTFTATANTTDVSSVSVSFFSKTGLAAVFQNLTVTPGTPINHAFDSVLTDMTAKVVIQYATQQPDNDDAPELLGKRPKFWTTTPPTGSVVQLVITNSDSVTLFDDKLVTEANPQLFVVQNSNIIKPQDANDNLFWVYPQSYTSSDSLAVIAIGAYFYHPGGAFPTSFDFKLHSTAAFHTQVLSNDAKLCRINGVDANAELSSDGQTVTITTPDNLYIANHHFVYIQCDGTDGYGIQWKVNGNTMEEFLTLSAILPTNRMDASEAGPTLRYTNAINIAKFQLDTTTNRDAPQLEFGAAWRRWKKYNRHFSCTSLVSFLRPADYALPIEVQGVIGGARVQPGAFKNNQLWQSIEVEGSFFDQWEKGLFYTHTLPVNNNPEVPADEFVGRTPSVIVAKGFKGLSKDSAQRFLTNEKHSLTMSSDLTRFDITDEKWMQCTFLVKKYIAALSTDPTAPLPDYSWALHTESFRVYSPAAPIQTQTGASVGLETWTTGKSKQNTDKDWQKIRVQNRQKKKIDEIVVYHPLFQNRFTRDKPGDMVIEDDGHRFIPTVWTYNLVKFKIENTKAQGEARNYLDVNKKSITFRSKVVRFEDIANDVSYGKKKGREENKPLYHFDYRQAMPKWYNATAADLHQYATLRSQSIIMNDNNNRQQQQQRVIAYAPSYDELVNNEASVVVDDDEQNTNILQTIQSTISNLFGIENDQDDNDDEEEGQDFTIQQTLDNEEVIFISPKVKRSVKAITGGEYFHHNSFTQITVYEQGNDVPVAITERRVSWKPMEGWVIALCIVLPIGGVIVLFASIIIWASCRKRPDNLNNPETPVEQN